MAQAPDRRGHRGQHPQGPICGSSATTCCRSSAAARSPQSTTSSSRPSRSTSSMSGPRSSPPRSAASSCATPKGDSDGRSRTRPSTSSSCSSFESSRTRCGEGGSTTNPASRVERLKVRRRKGAILEADELESLDRGRDPARAHRFAHGSSPSRGPAAARRRAPLLARDRLTSRHRVVDGRLLLSRSQRPRRPYATTGEGR